MVDFVRFNYYFLIRWNNVTHKLNNLSISYGLILIKMPKR